MALTVPVIPGKAQMSVCCACGMSSDKTIVVLVDRVRCVMCIDFLSCTFRYRLGMTPREYQTYLRSKVSLDR